eukprot:TRINITY_DN22469_c0_g1_i1.p1 TRINITY_DN22469_c0_g1~~TRINITY_DN22469_c0_g1_i1.p1  ORF type:complete len:619 (+),score=55.51 TRINITY_DN22469_c0_g1_i1:856-2712(+)
MLLSSLLGGNKHGQRNVDVIKSHQDVATDGEARLPLATISNDECLNPSISGDDVSWDKFAGPPPMSSTGGSPRDAAPISGKKTKDQSRITRLFAQVPARRPASVFAQPTKDGEVKPVESPTFAGWTKGLSVNASHESTARHVGATAISIDEETANKGRTKGGPTREGTSREGATREGTTKEGPIREGAIRVPPPPPPSPRIGKGPTSSNEGTMPTSKGRSIFRSIISPLRERPTVQKDGLGSEKARKRSVVESDQEKNSLDQGGKRSMLGITSYEALQSSQVVPSWKVVESREPRPLDARHLDARQLWPPSSDKSRVDLWLEANIGVGPPPPMSIGEWEPSPDDMSQSSTGADSLTSATGLARSRRRGHRREASEGAVVLEEAPIIEEIPTPAQPHPDRSVDSFQKNSLERADSNNELPAIFKSFQRRKFIAPHTGYTDIFRNDVGSGADIKDPPPVDREDGARALFEKAAKRSSLPWHQPSEERGSGERDGGARDSGETTSGERGLGADRHGREERRETGEEFDEHESRFTGLFLEAQRGEGGLPTMPMSSPHTFRAEDSVSGQSSYKRWWRSVRMGLPPSFPSSNTHPPSASPRPRRFGLNFERGWPTLSGSTKAS